MNIAIGTNVQNSEATSFRKSRWETFGGPRKYLKNMKDQIQDGVSEFSGKDMSET